MEKTAKRAKKGERLSGTLTTGQKIWQNKWLYVMFLPMLVLLLIFNYYPMYGVQLAFKDFNLALGITGSPWTKNYGFNNFIRIFKNPDFNRALKNTIQISLSRLVFEFPVPIILALMINEIRSSKFKRVVQTVYTFPHFISWIIVYGLFFNIFNSTGIYNQLLGVFGLPSQQILGDPKTFRPMLYISNNWKEMGWSSIIYLASITGISPDLYEAARIDGASRRQLVTRITLPCILGTIAIMFTMQVSSLLSAGFDQIFNMYNPGVYEVADVLDTLIYRSSFSASGLGARQFGVTTAMGLFCSVIGFTLLMLANTLVKKMTGHGIY